MARLKSTSFGLNSTTANVELTGNDSANAATIISGGYLGTNVLLGRKNVANDLYYQFASSPAGGPYYSAVEFKVKSAPSADEKRIFYFAERTVSDRVRVLINT